MTTNNQYYVFTKQSPPGSYFPFVAELKRATAPGEFMTLITGRGFAPVEALDNLSLQLWDIDESKIIYVRENTSNEKINSVVKE